MKKIKASVFALIKYQDKVLVGLRSKDSGNGGTWCFFGGGIDEGETRRATLKRELQEEINFFSIVNKSDYIIDNTVYKITWDKKKTTFIYTIILSDKFKPKLNKEHTAFKWTTLDKLKSMKIHPIVKTFLKFHD